MTQALLQDPGLPWTERAWLLHWPGAAGTPQGDASTSVAILTEPVGGHKHRPAVVLLTGGAQMRWGAHRQQVLLARQLAELGHPVLRFDWPGLGDAGGTPLSFEHTAPCIQQVTEALHAQLPQLDGVVLLGLCDGASAALLHAAAPASATRQVRGLVLINPWMRSEASLAQAQLKHYYLQRVLSVAFWRKLLRGGVGWAAVREFAQKLRRQANAAASPSPRATATSSGSSATATASYPDRMVQGWRTHVGPILLFISGNDLTGQEFLDQARAASFWGRRHSDTDLTLHVVTGADHTCSTPEAHQALLTALRDWLPRC